MNFKFIVNILCICLILLIIIPVSMGADEDLDYKSGEVNLSTGAYTFVNYDIDGGSTRPPISDSLYWDTIHFYDYTSLKFENVKVTYSGGYSDIPATVGDPFTFRYYAGENVDVFRGNVYYYKQGDYGTYATVSILYDFTWINKSWMAEKKDLGGKLSMQNLESLDTISTYYDGVYNNQNETQADWLFDEWGLILNYETANDNYLPAVPSGEEGTAYCGYQVHFYNEYEIYNNLWNKTLFVNKDFDDFEVSSSIYVYDSDNVLVLHTDNNSLNISHTFLPDPIRIDLYANDIDYTVTIWDDTSYIQPEAYMIAGRVVNGKTNSLVDNAQISLNGYSTYSNITGYYELDVLEGTYTLWANHTDYMSYTIPNLTISENIVIDLILSPYGINSSTGESDSTVPYLAGTIKNQNTYEPIENVYISLSNQTETYNQYSNANGHFEIYPDSNGTYNLLAQNQDYYTFEANITIAGGTVQNILLVPATLIEVPTNETAPEDIQGAFISMLEDFGFSSEWVKIIISIVIILGSGYVGTLFTKKDNPIIVVVAMFFGFIASVALSLLSPMFLVIVIVVIVMSILYLR